MNTALRDQNTPHGQNIPESSPSETNSLKGSKPDKQIPVLDGLRAIACLIVLSFHVNLFARRSDIWLPLQNTSELNVIFALNQYLGDYFADSGIVLFFLLSSFLLFLPYAKSLLFDSPWPSLRRFYLRGIFRILPGYYVALLLIALFFHPEFLHSTHWHDLWLLLTFRMDYHLSEKLNSPFWTLAIEFQFYLLLPLIAWFLRLMVRRGTVGWRMLKLTFWLLIMIAWGLLTRYWGRLFIGDAPKVDFLIPHSISTTLIPFIYGDRGKYFEVFAVGMLLCMVYTYTQNSPLAEHWSIRMRRLSLLMFMSGFVLIFFLSLWHFYTISITSRYTEYHLIIKTPFDSYASIIAASWFQWEAMAYAISYGLCLWALLYGSPRLKHPFEWSVLRWVGLISFSLYMWHFPFINLFVSVINYQIRRQGWGPLVQYGALWCWVLVVIIPISAMLYRWIEQPGMRLGERLIRKFEMRKVTNPSSLPE